MAVLVASVTYNQITEVYPSKSKFSRRAQLQAHAAALTSFPNPLPENLTEHDMFPALASAVRDLANDNIITAVMLTGVMLLQVRSSARLWNRRGIPRYPALASRSWSSF